MQVKATIGIAFLAMALATVPAAAQVSGNQGLELIKALKDGDSAKAHDIAESAGPSVLDYHIQGQDGALHLVTRMRNGQWIGYLLSKGADPDIVGENGDTPLIIAARSGYSEGVARLLMARASVDQTNRGGETALIVAVQQRQPAIVGILLKAGADPDKVDHVAGLSARQYAKRETRVPEMLEMIEKVDEARKGKAAILQPGKPIDLPKRDDR